VSERAIVRLPSHGVDRFAIGRGAFSDLKDATLAGQPKAEELLAAA
jgi:hypothetical protein